MEKIRNFVGKNKISISFFALIAIITTILAYFLVNIQSQIGVAYWDIFLYLNNSLKMAGMGVGDALHLSPFLPAVTSIFFRAGWVSETALFTVCALFYILGTLGMYLLLKLRFNEYESMAGALAFATFTIIVSWAVTGALDVPAISLTIWAIYLTFLAVKKDSKFFYLAFPVAMMAFLTRFTSGLIIIPILLIIYMNWSRVEIKKAALGMGLGGLVYLPFMWFFYRNIGKPFPFWDQFFGTTKAASSKIPGFNADYLYYLKNIPNYISSLATPDSYFKIIWPSKTDPTILAYVVLALIIIGIVIYLIRVGMDAWLQEKEVASRKPFILKAAIALILGVVALATYSHITYIYSELLLIIFTISVYILLKDYKELKYLDMDLVFFIWFGAFLVMHSSHLVKVDRYFVTMIPPLVYGLSLGINQISSLIKYKFKGVNLTSPLISVLLVTALLFSTGFYLADMPREDQLVQSERSASQWLIQYDHQYSEKVIASDRGPAYSWYLKKFVYTRISEKIDRDVFKELIDEIHPDYYISSLGIDPSLLEGYHKIKTIGRVTIYQKN